MRNASRVVAGLAEVGVDAEGFTVGLQELATLAAVLDPYESASEELLGRFVGVTVSAEKWQALVRAEGAAADALWQAPASAPRPAAPATPLYAALDGGMIFVDGGWQEVKLGVVFGAEHRVDHERRPGLAARQVVAVRGTPGALAARLWPCAHALRSDERQVVVLGDGAPWIWNLAEVVFPRRVEILYWYQADEHVSATARALYGEGTPTAAAWRQVQLDRLWPDGGRSGD